MRWQQCIDLTAIDNPLTPALKSMLKAISAVGMCGTRSKKFIVDGSFIVAMCSDFLEEYPVFDAERFDPTVSVQSDEGRSIMWLRAVAMILLGLEIGARAGEITRMTVCCWQARDDGSVYVLVHLAKNGKNGELIRCSVGTRGRRLQGQLFGNIIFRGVLFPLSSFTGPGTQ